MLPLYLEQSATEGIAEKMAFGESIGTLELPASDPKTSKQKASGQGKARLPVAKFWPFVPFHAVLACLLLTLVFILAHGKVADPDIWWHLHNADYLVHHHSLPGSDMFSFTIPGYPWMNHEWLAELPYYFAWRAMGIQGIESITLAILGVIFLGVLYLAYKASGNFKAAVLATSYSVFLGRVSVGPRTILFGYACLVVLLIILQRLRQKGTAPLWLIPPLFCLWINTHGSWFIGMLIFSTIVATGMVRLQWGMIDGEPWTTRQRKNLLMAWGASVAALFINPFGAKLVFYPLDLAFRQKLNIEHVEEWVSVNFHDARGKFVVVLLIILVVSWLLKPRKWGLSELAVTLFAVYSGLTYIRFLFLLGIVIAPVLAKALDFVPPYRRERDTPVVNTLAILLMVAGVAHYWSHEKELQKSVDDQYPVKAVAYLQTHAAGPTVNYYLWGGYLNWIDPRLKVFVDGRADIFEYSGIFKDYLSLLMIDDPDTILDKYQARYVLFPPHDPFTHFLEHDARWKTAYRDDTCVLFERSAGSPVLEQQLH